jgi:hypothetical protein
MMARRSATVSLRELVSLLVILYINLLMPVGQGGGQNRYNAFGGPSGVLSRRWRDWHQCTKSNNHTVIWLVAIIRTISAANNTGNHPRAEIMYATCRLPQRQSTYRRRES